MAIHAALKRLLKARGRTYAEAAGVLELSEASVKRLFASGDLSLERLERLCDWIGVDIADVVEDAVLGGVAGRCSTRIARLPNGITIFPGGIPLYKDGRLAGAIGISGDGVDQDDLIAAAGTRGFEAPETMRSDQVIVRGVRLPDVKVPRHPEL